MKSRVLLLIATILMSFSVWAEDAIKIGMSTALTGPVAALGSNMRLGINSYFELVNKNGGVAGRKLELIALDDSYEPERAAVNMRDLIDHHGVLAVIGNVGTPTAIVSVPIAKEKKTLLFGAFSGGEVLRSEPANRYVINYRPSYAEETSEIIQGLLSNGIKPTEIAFFTQRDGYGGAGYQGAINALHLAGFQNTDELAHGRYTRNTLNVENAVAVILDAPITPKAVIMAGGYAPSAKFIKLLRAEIPNMLFINLSFVGSYSLKEALGDEADNVIVVQAVPALESNLSIIQDYSNALKQYDPELVLNSVSLEGFIVAKIFHQGLLHINGDITKESIIDGLESLHRHDIGLGSDITYDEAEHQAVHRVWLTYFQNGKTKAFTWSMLEQKGN